MSPADLDALREGLAEAAFRHAHAYPEKVCWAEVGRIASAIPDGVVAVAVEAAYARADALIASPILSDLIAKAGRVDAAEKERDEARVEAGNLREGLARLIAEQVRTALAATQPDSTEAPASADFSTQEGQSHGQ